MTKTAPILLVAFALSCDGVSTGTDLDVHNAKTVETTVYVAFGSDSKITADSWAFCTGSGLNCNFTVAAQTTKPLPNPKGEYINATFAFDSEVGCGSTKAEVNLNNPKWYDTSDVSLVDGYSNDVQIDVTPKGSNAITLGPPIGKDGNEKVYGLYPYGCDICVERQSPPCDIPKGKTGCKTGTQSKPDVPCQYQGLTKAGGDSAVVITLNE